MARLFLVKHLIMGALMHLKILQKYQMVLLQLDIFSQDPNNTFYTEGQGYLMFLDNMGNEISSMNLNSYISQAYRVQYFNDEIIISGLTEEAFDFKLIKMNLDKV